MENNNSDKRFVKVDASGLYGSFPPHLEPSAETLEVVHKILDAECSLSRERLPIVIGAGNNGKVSLAMATQMLREKQIKSEGFHNDVFVSEHTLDKATEMEDAAHKGTLLYELPDGETLPITEGVIDYLKFASIKPIHLPEFEQMSMEMDESTFKDKLVLYDENNLNNKISKHRKPVEQKRKEILKRRKKNKFK